MAIEHGTPLSDQAELSFLRSEVKRLSECPAQLATAHEENERLRETVDVLSNAETVKALTASMEDIKAGRVIAFEKIGLLLEARAERDAALSLLDQAREAIVAVTTMWDRGPCPRKFDEAIGWRENDEKAQSMAVAVLAKIDAARKPPGGDVK